MATRLALNLATSGSDIHRRNKHQQKTELTRAKLLKAARRIFARDGFQASRIEDIAAEAGHTRGAFYAHFGTKEDLFFALLEQQSKEHVDKLRRILEVHPGTKQRLAALREYYVDRAEDRQWVMLLLEFKLFALRGGRLRAKWAAIHARIRASLRMELSQSLPADLKVSSETAELRKIALEALLGGLVLEHAYDPKRISEDETRSLLKHMFDLLFNLNSPKPVER